MPSGQYNPNASDYSKIQGGEVGVDASLRKIVKIGAVSGGVSMPVSGSVTISGTANVSVVNTVGVSGAVSISGTPTVQVSGTPSVSVVNTVTVEGSVDVEIQGTPTVSVVNTPTVEVGNTVTVDGVISAELITENKGVYAVTLLSFSAASGTETAVAAQGATTATKVLGIMICNENTDAGRRFEFRFGSTAFIRGYVAPELPINWQLVGSPPVSANNKAVIVWANGTITAPITVCYTKV